MTSNYVLHVQGTRPSKVQFLNTACALQLNVDGRIDREAVFAASSVSSGHNTSFTIGIADAEEPLVECTRNAKNWTFADKDGKVVEHPFCNTKRSSAKKGAALSESTRDMRVDLYEAVGAVAKIYTPELKVSTRGSTAGVKVVKAQLDMLTQIMVDELRKMEQHADKSDDELIAYIHDLQKERAEADESTRAAARAKA